MTAYIIEIHARLEHLIFHEVTRVRKRMRNGRDKRLPPLEKDAARLTFLLFLLKHIGDSGKNLKGEHVSKLTDAYDLIEELIPIVEDGGISGLDADERYRVRSFFPFEGVLTSTVRKRLLRAMRVTLRKIDAAIEK